MMRFSWVLLLIGIAAISAKSAVEENSLDFSNDLEVRGAGPDDDFEDLEEKSLFGAPEESDGEDDSMKRELTGMEDSKDNDAEKRGYRHHGCKRCKLYVKWRSYYYARYRAYYKAYRRYALYVRRYCHSRG